MPTVSELKKQAKERGLRGYSKMKKAELEKLLSGADAAKKAAKESQKPKPKSPPKSSPKPSPPKKEKSAMERFSDFFNKGGDEEYEKKFGKEATIKKRFEIQEDVKAEQFASKRPKQDKFYALHIGARNKATSINAEFNPVSMILKVKNSALKLHAGVDSGVKGTMVDMKMTPSKDGDYLVNTKYRIKLGTLGEGEEDKHGLNIVPYLKNTEKQHYYGIVGRPESYTKKFIRGYEKGGRILGR